MTRPDKHAESNNAKSKNIFPISNIRPKTISSFLDSQKLPETQRNILLNASTGVWHRAAKQSGAVGSYTTGLSPDKPVPHYHLGAAAMYILKHGSDKIADMGNKIKQDRAEKIAKSAYNPLDIFRDRRQG